MKRSLRVVLFILVSLASCAKHAITKVSVKIDDAFSGHFSLTTCIPGVEELAVLGTNESTRRKLSSEQGIFQKPRAAKLENVEQACRSASRRISSGNIGRSGPDERNPISWLSR